MKKLRVWYYNNLDPERQKEFDVVDESQRGFVDDVARELDIDIVGTASLSDPKEDYSKIVPILVRYLLKENDLSLEETSCGVMHFP